MELGDLLDLAALLDQYAPHAHRHGYHAAADWAASLRAVVVAEVKHIEQATMEAR